ncbi:MAG: type III polyketide synthase [Acidobacteria bacterium]|nr:type III polyketide synthase [Acidobacteriota bacterium]
MNPPTTCLPRIAGVAEAFPEHYYDQETLLGALREMWRDSGINMATLERLHRHAGVQGRYLALPVEQYGTLRSFGESNDLWIRCAEELGERAVRDVLDRAGLDLADVRALVFVSVTGVATPSIDARLVNRMGLPVTIKRIPLFGLGCVAGAAGLALSADLSRSYPDGAVVLLSVELCTLTVQLDDHSTANQIATGLFGDGAAAVAIVGNGHAAHGPSIVATRSVFYPNTERAMGWDISERGFKLVLDRDVPRLVAENLPGDVDRFLAEHDLERRDIRSWIAHTGGPKILSAIQETLELPRDALDLTWEQLRSVGNVSSASVLQVLNRTLEKGRLGPGEHGLLMAMGPGFCCELVLVRGN